MVASLARRAPLAARSMFGVALLLVSTEQSAYQDLASLLVSQPGVAERARTFLLSNPFSTLRTATFSLPNPIGIAIPRLPLPDHFEVLTASLPDAGGSAIELETPLASGPEVVRSGKGDRIVPAPKMTVRTMEPKKLAPEPAAAGASAADAVDTGLSVIDVEPFAETSDFLGTIARDINPVPPSGALVRLSRFYFGADANELPPLAFEHVLPSPVERLRFVALSDGSVDLSTSVVRKGVVTGDEATPKSPAERLGLAGLKRAKAEKCLADAIYFESRGEVERGQVAVAQVVINRVFSGYYPEDVCETVYQNAHRYLACQFTFACEGKKLIVNDQAAWTRATRISRDMLDGKLWLNEVGKATHYHANWVRPAWVREMRTIQRIGVHTFYRPRKWDETDTES
ncbi:MAG: cell wall hydrolase [Bradyrhizobiaceae bacterium]|nr:cell wall hydrolase [Bradyrhizobiaceae bacterium]